MIDLDEAGLPEFEFKYNGKVHRFDTVLIVDQMAKLVNGLTEPAKIRDEINKIFGVALATDKAILLMRAFQEHTTKYEALLGKLFGLPQSSPTTTESDLKNTEGSTQESVSVSS